jgi:hypothetical protein
MHRTERMGADGIFRKMVILVILTPFLLVILNYNGVVAAQRMSPQEISLNDTVLVAGEFRYLNVTILKGTEKITIMAFSGTDPPMQQNRSIENFYQWEYDDGIWKDACGYATSSLDLSHCHRNNNTVSFYIQISQGAKPGSWTILVLVDNKVISANSFKLFVSNLCFFFSTMIGIFEPPLREKYFFQENNVKTFEREKRLLTVKNNIEKIVDATLKEKASFSKEVEPFNDHMDLCDGPFTSPIQQASLRPTVALYPRSKLKDFGVNIKESLSITKRQGRGGIGFSTKNNDVMKRVGTMILLCMMLSASVLPIIGMVGRNENLGEITILNPQCYPPIGGVWTVLFTTVGCANLTITAINGTTWSDSDQDHDLEFLRCLRGNETLAYSWVNNSVCILNFSSNETCAEVSEVLQPGFHTLMFQFGTSIAFAHNLATENWLQTTTSDFNNGTKTNINVSSNSFHLQERYLFRNFTRINNESFEGSWPPAGWAEVPSTSNWYKANERVYQGSYAAGFNGSGGHGAASGELQSPSMNCSGANVTAIYVKFWAYSYRGVADTYYLDYYNGATWNQIIRLDNFGVSTWAQYIQKITDRQYFVPNFQIRWRVIGLQNNRNYYVDVVNVTVERNESGYYATGNLVSQPHDTTRNMPDYKTMIVGKTAPSGTTVTPWVKTADSQANLSSAVWYSNITLAPKKRWVQWRINLTGNTYVVPTVNDVNVTWIYDNEKPVSAVAILSPYWKISTPFQITATASDNGTGVKEVALYYNFSATNSSGWSGWTLFDVNATTNPYSWSFTPPNGDGYYRFYSRAVDGELNVENPPSSPDTFCGIDTTKPSSFVDAILKYWHNATSNPLTITVVNASDATSGINNVTLYYKYRKDNSSSWSSWVIFSVDQVAPWSWNFNFPSGEGHYRFYSIAYDKAGNGEDAPVSPDYDTQGGYDISKPSSQVNTISPYIITFNPLSLSANASDDVTTVTLYYYYSARNSSWWNPNWQYRKQLTINGRNSGYQMKIIVGNISGGTVNCNGHARGTFGDIRFISYSDNSTQLSYWLKNYTAGVQATFWVNNSRNDSSIWMYYGNRNAVTTSNGDATFYFFDDFSNGLGKWVMDAWNSDAIAVNLSQGNPSPSLKHIPDNSIPANRTYQDTRIRTATYKMRNGTIEYDVYLAGTPRIIYQFGWRVNALSWTNGYSWRLQNANGDGGFFRFTGPTSWTQLGSSFPNAAVNTWYHVQLNVSGSNYAAIVNPACGGATTRSASDTTKLTADYLVSHVHGVSMDATNYVLVDNIFVRKYRASPSTWGGVGSEEQGYVKWNNASNPDTGLPWGWNFNFPLSYGYYWFYSLAIDFDGNAEDSPATADARCYYSTGVAPVINSYDLRNSTGSKLDNATGLLDVNKEYYFTVNVTAKYGWVYVDYIDIKAWYDQGSELSSYNQSLGGNLNMYLRYENITGNASFKLLWPKIEVQLITGNCSQTIFNSSTRIIKISFKPLSQIRWACSNNTWDSTKNTSNDPFSWNFNITVIDTDDLKATKNDEFGVYQFATIMPDRNWVNVYAPPGYNATTNVVNITYSSNYNYNISVFFRENLTNISSGSIIPIANNVYLLANADLTDDVTTDIMFTGIGEAHAVNIITTSGVFNNNDTSTVVHVQFNVYIPLGTLKGLYTAHVGTKIKQKL